MNFEKMINSVRVGLRPTFLIITDEFLLSNVSAEKKAAEDGSFGTLILKDPNVFFHK